MTKPKTSQNGGSKDVVNSIDKAVVEYPVTFVLKAVMDKLGTDDVNKEIISMVLDNLEIKNNYLNCKNSSKGTYTSYNYEVTLINKPQLETMYEQLKTLPGLKFAI